MARAPALSVGKRRLARDVGDVEAWRVSRLLYARALQTLRDPRWRLIVRITPDRAARRAPFERQGRGDLGHRLARALRAHAAGPVAVAGTDCPQLTRVHVAAAFRAVRRTGVAVAPAEDGGFVLLALGARRARQVGFSTVRWSSEHTLADVERAIGPVERTSTLPDIDVGRDWRAWRQRR